MSFDMISEVCDVCCAEEDLINLSCGHIFCVGCLTVEDDKYTINIGECPLCDTPISEDIKRKRASALQSRHQSSDECYVCAKSEHETINPSNCGHKVCKNCLTNSFRQGKVTCPVCDKSVSSSVKVKITYDDPINRDSELLQLKISYRNKCNGLGSKLYIAKVEDHIGDALVVRFCGDSPRCHAHNVTPRALIDKVSRGCFPSKHRIQFINMGIGGRYSYNKCDCFKVSVKN
jgi:hypothetical protein